MATRRTAGRLKASLGLVSAVGLMVAVTCAVVAAIVVYRDAIVTQGVRSTIENAAATDRAIDVTVRAPAADVAEVTERLGAGALGAFEPAVFAVSPSYRITEPSIDDASNPEPAADEPAIITRVATFAGDDLWQVVSGDLAPLEATDASVPVPAVLHVDAASLLGLETGDSVRLEPSTAGRTDGLELQVVALVTPADPGDPRWFAQPFGRAGSTSSGSFVDVGPFLVPAVDFAQIGGDASYIARLAVDPDRVEPGDIDGIVRAVEAAPDTLATALAPDRVRVESGLDDLLANVDTSVRSTTAVVAAVLLQVAAVALFGLAVAASVLFASRRSERILLHSRGISNAQVIRDALAEAAVIVVPAAIIGPFLAVGAVGLVGRWGPIESAGLDLRGAASAGAFAASAAAAGIAVALIVWPSIAAARLPADEVGRPTGTPFLRRTGLDIVLTVLAVAGLWQLQRTGSVASTAEPGGRTSVDPVLVLAPTLGIAAASLLAVRMLGVAANGLERVGARSRRLAPALAGREAARSGGRRNRSSVLVVVAVAVASFALIQSVSWERSQRDQADAAVGADVVVVPDGRPDAGVAAANLAAGYRALEGVTAVWPIGDRSVAVAAQPRPVPLVALDAGEFATYSRTRHDVVADADMIATLASPVDLGGVELPASGGEVTARIRLSASTPAPDGETQPTPTEAEIAIVVTDEFGTPRRLAAVEPVVTADGGATTTEVTFGRVDATGGDDRRAHLVEIEVDVPIPFIDVRTFVSDVDGDGVDDTSPLDVPSVRTGIELLELDVGGAALDLGQAAWTPLAPAPARVTISPPAASVDVVDAVDAVDAALALDLDAGTTAQRQASAQFRFVTADAEAVEGFTDGTTPVDVLATPQLVEELAVGLDTPVSVRIGGTRLALRIVGETGVVPFAADEPLAFLADHATLAAADYLASGARSEPDRWVVVLDESDREAVTTILREAPFESAAVADRWERAEQRIGDPILVGLTGSLLIAVGAVAIVAIVGLVMAAVTGARDRRGANAVLRALGASRRELRQWLVRETVPIGVLAIAIGLAGGVVIASVVSSALTGDGGDAVPPPQLVVPWVALAALVGVGLVAIALVPLATSRLLRGVRPADELRIGDQR